MDPLARNLAEVAAQSTAENPSLLELLLAEFDKALVAKFGDDTAARDVMFKRAKLFVDFGQQYLMHNRPSTIGPTGGNNMSVTLTNAQHVTIAPPEPDLAGTMVSSTGIPIDPTPGAVTPDVIANQGAVMISGNTKKHQGAIDYADKGYGGSQQYADRRTDGRTHIEYNPPGREANVDPFNR